MVTTPLSTRRIAHVSAAQALAKQFRPPDGPMGNTSTSTSCRPLIKLLRTDLTDLRFNLHGSALPSISVRASRAQEEALAAVSSITARTAAALRRHQQRWPRRRRRGHPSGRRRRAPRPKPPRMPPPPEQQVVEMVRAEHDSVNQTNKWQNVRTC